MSTHRLSPAVGIAVEPPSADIIRDAMDEVSPPLREYGRARDARFAGVVRRLEADERIRAAWLSGSHGRDEDDEWSDFDFHVAVRDEDMEWILRDPLPLFGLGGEVLLVQANFPSDSMPGGRFWLVVYPGPIEIDWNVGPISAAARPRASRVLFEKEPIPFAAEPAPLSREEACEQARPALEFFWAMAPIAIKYAGRGWTPRAVQQCGLVSRAFAPLWRMAEGPPWRGKHAYNQNQPPEKEFQAVWPGFGRVIDGSEALRLIAAQCNAVEALHPAFTRLGIPVPERMSGEVRRLLEIAKREVARGALRCGTGSRR